MNFFSEEIFPPSDKPKEEGWYYDYVEDAVNDIKVGTEICGIDYRSKEHIMGVVIEIRANQIKSFYLYVLNTGKSLYAHEIVRWSL